MEWLGENGIKVTDVEDFNNCLFSIGMDDMLTKGNNKRDGMDNIQSRIDRVVCV